MSIIFNIFKNPIFLYIKYYIKVDGKGNKKTDKENKKII